jgi:hypothetical protein
VYFGAAPFNSQAGPPQRIQKSAVFGVFMGIINRLVKIADRLTDSWSTRVALNHYLQKYGEVTTLKINRQSKAIDVEVKLRGEADPLFLHVSSYDFVPASSGQASARITFHGVTASRQWLNQLAADFLENKPLEVPSEVARYLPMVL